MKQQNYNLVQAKRLDSDLLTALAEGRVYIAPKQESAEDLREKGIQAILDYVSRIDDYTSSQYRSSIRDIWSEILHDETLGGLFFFNRYASQRGSVNWYRVTALVGFMRERSVYSHDHTLSDLHCTLEGTTQRTKYYIGMSRYLLEGEPCKRVRKVLQKYQR